MSDLISFFTQRDIVFEPVGEGGISSAFSTTLPDGHDHAFSLFVLPLEDGFGDRYVRFTIVPFMEQPFEGYPDSLYITVGQINHDLPQLKFAFDGDGDLELTFDALADKLDDAEFDRALQVMADYAGAYYPELASVVEST